MKKKKQWIDILFCVVLFLLPFLHVNVGIGIADQGYNLANFEAFPDMNQTWMISTLVANLVGKFFTFLPFGHTMLGMNVYCTLLLAAMSVGMYLILKSVYCRYGVFAGLVIAICFSWAPKVTLYQYLSYYLFCIGAVVLICGLQRNKRSLMFAAGIILGVNLFVRFPNILQAALIVVVLFSAILTRRRIKETLLDVLTCVGGYMTVMLPGILLIELCFGKGTYLNMINGLFAISDTAEAYSPFSMFYAMYNSYRTNLKWFLPFVLLMLLGLTVYGFLHKRFLRTVLYGILGILFLFVLRVYWYYGILNMDYMTYNSVYVWGVCLLLLGILFMGLSLFLKKVTPEQKLYSMAGLVIIFISPLGSNNALYSNYNNLYLVAPVLLGTLITLWKEHIPDKKEGGEKKKIWRFSWKPVTTVGAMLLAVVFFQTFLFHTFFIFGDAGMDGMPKVTVEENKVLAGMKTTRENAEMLSELTIYAKDNLPEDAQYIVWGRSPLLYYALELDCAIGHFWPSLDSYPYEELETDMAAMENYPVIIYEAMYYEDLFAGAPEWDKKAELVSELLREGKYSEVFRNDYYAVCIPNVKK